MVRFFTVNTFLRLTVKILSFLRLTAKFLAVLRLTVNPIETLFLVLRRGSFVVHIGIIYGSGSFAVQFGDHLRSGHHLRSGIICGAVHTAVQFLFAFHEGERFLMQSKSTFLEFLRGIHRYKFGLPKIFFRGEIIQGE